MKNCKKCDKEFEPSRGLINFCSLKCRNSRTWTDEDKKKKSESAINSEKLKLAAAKKEKLIGSRNPNYKGLDKYHIINCKICNAQFTKRKCIPTKTCSRKCSIIASTSRTYLNGSRKTFYYKGIILESSWELEIAILLDSLNIKWTRPGPLNWIDKNNKIRLYYPDFYLPNLDVYLDPKNPYCMEKDNEKMKKISESVDIIYGDIKIVKEYIHRVVG